MDRYRALEKKAYHFYNCVQPEHHHIDVIRKDLQNYLESLLHSGLGKKKILNSFLSVYNKNIPNLIISDEGNLEPNKFIINQDILINHDYEKYPASFCSALNCNCIYHQIIAYSLVNFLQNKNNKLKLKKCHYCQNLYVAQKLNPKQRYCTVCSQKNKMTTDERAAYQKGYRANPTVIKRKREAKIKEIMHNTGRTINEVEASLDD